MQVCQANICRDAKGRVLGFDLGVFFQVGGHLGIPPDTLAALLPYAQRGLLDAAEEVPDDDPTDDEGE